MKNTKSSTVNLYDLRIRKKEGKMNIKHGYHSQYILNISQKQWDCVPGIKSDNDSRPTFHGYR